MDHKKFFLAYGDMLLNDSVYGPFTPETLYLAFKARLIEELRVNQKHLVNYGEGRGFVNEYIGLIDNPEQK